VGVEEHNETYRRIIEAIGRNDPDALDALVIRISLITAPGPTSPRGSTGSRTGFAR
jgi:hypothetical protein